MHCKLDSNKIYKQWVPGRPENYVIYQPITPVSYSKNESCWVCKLIIDNNYVYQFKHCGDEYLMYVLPECNVEVSKKELVIELL